jgi:hypothetical protein
VLNTSFNNSSGIFWLFVLLVEENGITTDLSQVTDQTANAEVIHSVMVSGAVAEIVAVPSRLKYELL